MMLSVIPSPRYSPSAPPSIVVNGSTASESIGMRPGGVVTSGVPKPMGDRVALIALEPEVCTLGFATGGDDVFRDSPRDTPVRVKTERTRPHRLSVRRMATDADAR